METGISDAVSSEYYTPSELVARYQGRISHRTLANWRSTGVSPPYTKVGGRILYPKEEVHRWERERTVKGTDQYRK